MSWVQEPTGGNGQEQAQGWREGQGERPTGRDRLPVLIRGARVGMAGQQLTPALNLHYPSSPPPPAGLARYPRYGTPACLAWPPPQASGPVACCCLLLLAALTSRGGAWRYGAGRGGMERAATPRRPGSEGNDQGTGSTIGEMSFDRF